ncbi:MULTISPECIES: DUF2760 domain-containing protein [unclassified Moritella]|uniref:DUF2760 domain-containing protein n=1 Tax=unclassified Moritella TaxID=2637987 RepID=UPI001BABF717|nr:MULTISPECIES: DUF2760 domain-containing protein [unclassified Moritella]QUM85169.1 DUF2760 domain-containing protein [Moritella sp. 28]QUM89398.1 DUF2760 domain-containing protein [Moritella sp. 36]
MNFDLTNITELPAGPDAAHIALFALTLILLLITLVRGGKKTVEIEKIVEKEVPVEIEKIVEVIKHVDVEKIVEIEKFVEIKAPLQEASPAAACQLLSLLQNEARFVDFIQEDLTGATDEQIGAAARIIHTGSKKVINEYFTFTPIRTEEEESQVTVAEGFNPSEIKLIGNVLGSAPYRGILVHQGWKISNVNLPKLAQGHNANIVAAAEVEL